MIRQSFNQGWLAGPKQSAFASFAGSAADIRAVMLPYDALRDQPRSADSAQASHTAYYPTHHANRTERAVIGAIGLAKYEVLHMLKCVSTIARF